MNAIMEGMKRVWKEFDSHEEAEEYSITQSLAKTSAQRLIETIEASLAHWEMMHGKVPEDALRNTTKIEVRDRKEKE